MNYWDTHGIFFLIGLLLFPRITVIFISSVTGGFFFWAVFLLFPRIVIAILAASTYWHTNPVLVLIAFLLCLGGEATEKGVVVKI
jgi:hypothetical protein